MGEEYGAIRTGKLGPIHTKVFTKVPQASSLQNRIDYRVQNNIAITVSRETFFALPGQSCQPQGRILIELVHIHCYAHQRRHRGAKNASCPREILRVGNFEPSNITGNAHHIMASLAHHGCVIAKVTGHRFIGGNQFRSHKTLRSLDTTEFVSVGPTLGDQRLRANAHERVHHKNVRYGTRGTSLNRFDYSIKNVQGHQRPRCVVDEHNIGVLTQCG
tara:strand:+ start:18 stop:668 length:651 start_codon:yes stop_codon:yes gene_type:complete